MPTLIQGLFPMSIVAGDFMLFSDSRKIPARRWLGTTVRVVRLCPVGVEPAPEARHNGSPGREAWEGVQVEIERRRRGTSRRHTWDRIPHHVFPEA